MKHFVCIYACMAWHSIALHFLPWWEEWVRNENEQSESRLHMYMADTLGVDIAADTGTAAWSHGIYLSPLAYVDFLYYFWDARIE
jgi:hypothetical protein